ncbi:MAG: ADP-ribosylglycohydrolase family protein, partial [Acidobacteria bacterium]
KECLAQREHNEETARAVERAEELAVAGTPADKAIRQLGEGWVAEEALAISLYCALTAGDFRHGVVLAVNHDGDSHSTGAITGNILGTIHGVEGIPPCWLEELELREVITELATDLFECRTWDIGEHGQDEKLSAKVWKKHPGW